MAKRFQIFVIGAWIWLLPICAWALTQADVPVIYKNIEVIKGKPFVKNGDARLHLIVDEATPDYYVSQLRGRPEGTAHGFKFDFSDHRASRSPAGGKLFVSLINPKESRFPTPHYRFNADIDSSSRAQFNMDKLRGKYDLCGWETAGQGILYYRVQNKHGAILFESRFCFTTQPFRVAPSMVEGPFVCKVTPDSATIAFATNVPVAGKVAVDGKLFQSAAKGVSHEIRLTGLPPDETITYTAMAGSHHETFAFRTPPRPGARKPFVFAYSSDCRESIPSGERSMTGPNAYITRRIMALSAAKSARFVQFTGDTMSGYDANAPMQLVKYANFKQAILPYAARVPVYTGMGNHEMIDFAWDDGTQYGLQCDQFPFDSASSEAVFAKTFVNPENGPESEDGSIFDPQPHVPGTFPTYKENVYHYTWDNVAMVVLNSQYVYTPSLPAKPLVGGNIWGYMMDNQLNWLIETLDQFESDPAIDHVFVTQHTPVFPNGGHVAGFKSMWFNGENVKPEINGVDKEKVPGGIDRRDQFLTVLLNHAKVKAILVGDEHNYSRLLVKSGMPIYDPQKYVPAAPLNIFRPLWHICVGSAGAPYYYLEDALWNQGFPENTQYLKRFSAQHAVVFFHVHGNALKLEVVDPYTLDRIE